MIRSGTVGKPEPELARHRVIGLDTSPFIYLFERHPRYFSLSEAIFDYLKLPGIHGVTSIITLIETCVQPQRVGRQDLVEIYERALLGQSQVETIPIMPPVAKRAIALRVDYGFRVPDALQIAAALEQGATLFITNDRRLKKCTDLTVLALGDCL